MEEYQLAHVRQLLGAEEAHRAFLWGGEEVPDPLGSSQQAYEDVALQLERLLPKVVDEIVAAIEAEEHADAR